MLKNNTDKECTTKFGIPHFRQKCLPRVVDTKMCQDDNWILTEGGNRDREKKSKLKEIKKILKEFSRK